MRNLIRLLLSITLGTILVLGTFTLLEAGEPGMSKQEIKARIQIAHKAMDVLDMEEAYKQLHMVSTEKNLKLAMWDYCRAWNRWTKFYSLLCSYRNKG